MSLTIFASSEASLRRRLTLLSACALMAALGAAANLARAADAPSTQTVVVKYKDLDVATPKGAARLYRRIQSAAHQVCPGADSRRLGDQMASWSCRRQAVNRAVESVNSPEVAGLLKHPRLASAH